MSGLPVVFYAPVMPADGGNGLAMRAGLFLEAMARRHEVHVAVLDPASGVAAPNDFTEVLASSCVTIEPLGPADAKAWAGMLLSTAQGRRRATEIYPLPMTSRIPSPTGLAQLRDLTAGAALVHVMRSYLLPGLDFLLDADKRPPITLDLDELDSALQRQLGAEEESARFERLERYYLPLADCVYAATDEEAEAILHAYQLDGVSVVPNAVRLPPACERGDEEFDLLFVGNLSYEPNVAGVTWLCEEILPLLDGATLAIVGSGPDRRVQSFVEDPGVSVFGDVPEITSWYRRSRVAVVPLRIGGGSATKTLEALAHGRPVVSTPLGARGIDAGAGVLIARSAEEFAAACARLLQDPTAAVRLGSEGRRNVRAVGEVIDQIDLLTRSAVTGRSLPASEQVL